MPSIVCFFFSLVESQFGNAIASLRKNKGYTNTEVRLDIICLFSYIQNYLLKEKFKLNIFINNI